MALKVASMKELRLEVLLEPERTGESIAEVCARRGISRASFYRYRRRLLTEGRRASSRARSRGICEKLFISRRPSRHT